ncbi:hypothetical protein PRIPAC_87919 [Pristionchus pacificus]|uniref:protein-disulfide reductase n=1 Tax=Pristionchus pacificus TaxID=54126 RepID=A0A2A6BZ17_PRIPA|nr:hypothetical protein PRIPAC_87919 [Pristionchus pacificus]|eukprot:PDM71184.1 Thioredoxin [Pristionchus pacificus]
MASVFAGAKLYKNGGGEVDASVLEGKTVGIYFSAHWCPPCRNFTPLLKDFHAELVDADAEFEIVFVSFDRNEEDLKKYLEEAHGEWYYLGLGDALIQSLSAKYEVSGIPALIIVKPNGDLVTKNGRADVQAKPPAQALKAWTA